MNNLEISVARSIFEKINNEYGKRVSLIDCGANQGKFTDNVIDLIDNALLIEAIPHLSDKLVSKFPSFDVYNIAVCNETGTGTVYTPDNQYSKSSLNNRPAFIRELGSKKIIETIVEKGSLGDILQNNQKYDKNLWYLKLDVEGYELDAINTIDEVLSKRIVGGQFEYGGCWRERGISLLTMIEKLNSLGFVVLRPFMAPAGVKFSVLQYHHDTYNHTNFFFLPKEKIDLVA